MSLIKPTILKANEKTNNYKLYFWYVSGKWKSVHKLDPLQRWITLDRCQEVISSSPGTTYR